MQYIAISKNQNLAQTNYLRIKFFTYILYTTSIHFEQSFQSTHHLGFMDFGDVSLFFHWSV